MTKCGRNCKIRVLSCAFAAMMCLVLCFSLAGCDREETVSRVAYRLYLLGCAYDEESSTVTAYVTLSGTEEQRLADIVAEGERRAYKENLFFNRTNISVGLDCAAIYDAVLKRDVLTRRSTAEDQFGNSVEKEEKYDLLKVALRYDTIYKSIVTNGVRHPVGTGYADILPLDEVGMQEFALSQRSQNSANWYSLLIAGGIVLFAALTAVYLRSAHKKEIEDAKAADTLAALTKEAENAQKDGR